MISSAIVLQILLLVQWITTATGKAVPAPSKGCNKACQKECIEVLNEYRANHDAPKLQFSLELADKAQKWADGGKFGYDMDARGKYGQLIEWDVKDELPTFTSAIKHWHDKEKDFDFIAGKSKNGNTLHDFTQVVWKKAHKAGCGRGKLFGSRYYVVWMDADGIISPNGTDGSENVGHPKRADIHWFEITKETAVGKPLYWNATNSTKPSKGYPNVRVKTSLLPEDVEDLNSVESEQNVLNDANNIKQYVRDSLSSVLAEENKEVSQLRDEFEGLDDVPNVRLGSTSQQFYDGIGGGNTYDDRESGTKQIKPVTESLKWNKGIKQLTIKKGRKFQKEALKVQNNPMQKMDYRQQQVPMGKLPATVDAGQTEVTESSPTTVIHEELNISDKNVAAKSASSKPKQVKNNLSAGTRHGSQSETSQDGGKEMAGIIMGKLPDNETGNESKETSNGKILRIASDKNLSPEMENELSKVSKFINTRLKALNKNKEFHGTPGRELKNGYSVKDGNPEDPMNGRMEDEPGARPARITMVGAPLSFPEGKHKDIVNDIHEKVTALWKEHLKSKKGKEKKVNAQSNGEDDPSTQPYQDGFDDSLHGEGSSFSSSDEFHTVNGHHQWTYPDNYDRNYLNGPATNNAPINHGNSFNGFLHPGSDWFRGPAVPPVSPTFDNPITHAMNTGPGGLYEYRKKYTSEEPQKDTERLLQRKKNSLQSVVDVYEDKDGSVESEYSDKEKEPVLQPIKMPKNEGSVESEISSFKNTERTPQDHKDLLALPKELTERPDSEMTLASQLPDMISDIPSTSMTNSEESDHPGYFNEEPGLNRPTFVEQSSNQFHRNPTSNTYQTRPQYGYTQPQNSPVVQPRAGYPNNPYSYSQSYQYNPMQGVALPQGINQGYGYNQQQEPIQSVQEQNYNQGYGYPQQSQVQGLMSSMPQVVGISHGKPEQHFGNSPKPAQPQKILKGVSLPSSMGVITDNEAQQSGLTLSDKADKSSEKKPEIDNAPLTPSLPEEPTDEMKGKESKSDSKGPKNNAGGITNLPQNSLPQQAQGGDSGSQGASPSMPQNETQPQNGMPQEGSSNGMPQEGSSNGATVTVDGKPMKGPYESSGVYTVKGPFVYQTDTTIVMGGPQSSGGDKPMNGGESPSQVPNSTPQNAPPSSNNNNGQIKKPGNESSENEGNKSDPEPSKRPSLITLLKEAEMNKQKQSESKENKEKPEENKENEKPEGSTPGGERPESSGKNEKLPNEAAGNGSGSASGKETEGSSENGGQPSGPAEKQKEQQRPSQEAKPEESSESEEQPVESSQEGSSGEKGQQKESKAKKEPNKQLKIETEPNSPEQNKNTPAGSKENEKQPSGPTSNENQSGGSTGNEKPPSGTGTGNLPNGSPGNGKPPKGSSENEKQPSGASENENQASGSIDPSGSSGNEKQSSGSSVNEKRPSGSIEPSGSSDNQKPPSGSSENEKQPSGASENENQPSSASESGKQQGSSIDPSASSENENKPSSSSENGKPSAGSIDPSGPSENEEPSSGSSDNQKSPSGSSENRKQEGGSIDPSVSSANEKKPGGSSENEHPTSGSSENEKQPGDLSENKEPPSGSSENEKKPSGSSENKGPPTGSSENEEPPRGSSESEKKPSGSSENGGPPSGSSENEKPSRGSSENEKKPSGSSENEGPPSGSSENEEPSRGSSENEKKPSGSSENGGPPSGSSENEEPSRGSSESEKKPSGSSENGGPPSGSSENEEPSRGSSENEKKPSGSSENGGPPSGSSENEEPSRGSSENEKKPSGSSENGGPPSGSSENEEPSRGSSESEKKPSGSSENGGPPSGSSENEEPSRGSSESEKKPSGSSENGGPPSGSSENEEPSRGSSENEKKPSGSSENGGPPSGSSENEEPSRGSSENEKKPSGSSENGGPPSGSSENEEPPNGSIDPSSSSDNQKAPSGSSENENQPSGSIDATDGKETNSKEPFQNHYQQKILTQPETFEDAPQANKEGKEGVSIYEKPSFDLPKGAHYEPAIEPHNPSNSHGVTAAEEKPIQDQHHSAHSESQVDHSKQMKAKLLLPFTKLISNINHALGLDAPNSTLKINHISLSSKHPSGKMSQAVVPAEGKNVESSQEALPQESTEKAASHQPIVVDVPESNSVNGVGEALNLVPETNQMQGIKVDKPDLPTAHHGGMAAPSPVQEHRPLLGMLAAGTTTSGIHHLSGGERRPKDEHVTNMTDVSHSATGAPHVLEINENPLVEVVHPGLSCKDTGERCSLWQKKGYCRSILYAGFMKRHCKSTCGYCALPSIVIQSERANAGIKFAYEEHACQDSTNYEFSCPTWKAQGYCQKKEQEMRRFCRNTCNFCKRKEVPKKKKKAKDDTKHDQSSKAANAQLGNTSGQQPQSYVHAQTGKESSAANAQAGNYGGQQQPNYANAQSGQGKGAANAQAGNSGGQQQPNYAHAQVGKPSEPQSTASASGGSTYVQTQSSGGQQTGYAVASAAASPEQQTYAHAQSNSQSGQPSKAYAQNNPSSNNKLQSTAHAQTGSDEKPQNVAHAQTAPVNNEPKQSSKPKNHDEEKIAEAPSTSLHGMSLEERVIHDSPEYKATNNDYYIKAGNIDETAASEVNFYDEAPPIRFGNKNPEEPKTRYAGTEGNFEPGVEQNPEPESSAMGKFLDDAETKAGYSKDNLKDMEVKDNEDEKVKMLMNRFDPVMPDEQDDDLANDKSIISTRIPDKKGTLDFVSTEGCDQSCQRECLDAINSYRRNHKARPLVLDQDLADHAQKWADSKTYGHSPWAQEGMGGELIAVGSFYKTFTAAVKAWHDEEKDFDWGKGKLKKGKVIKHFKQLISKDAHVLGCGKSMINGEPYYIAQMDAAENMDNEKRETMEKPAKPDLSWYMESSPYWKDLQTREKIPYKVRRNLL